MEQSRLEKDNVPIVISNVDENISSGDVQPDADSQPAARQRCRRSLRARHRTPAALQRRPNAGTAT